MSSNMIMFLWEKRVRVSKNNLSNTKQILMYSVTEMVHLKIGHQNIYSCTSEIDLPLSHLNASPINQRQKVPLENKKG